MPLMPIGKLVENPSFLLEILVFHLKHYFLTPENGTPDWNITIDNDDGN